MGSLFCGTCGLGLQREAVVVACHVCNSISNASNYRICNFCGAPRIAAKAGVMEGLLASLGLADAYAALLQGRGIVQLSQLLVPEKLVALGVKPVHARKIAAAAQDLS